MYKKIVGAIVLGFLFLCGCGKDDYSNAVGDGSISYSCEEICVLDDCSYCGPTITVADSENFFYSDSSNNVYLRSIEADATPEKILTVDCDNIYSAYCENGILSILSYKMKDEDGYTDCLWKYSLESKTLECEELENNIEDVSAYFPETSCVWDAGFLYVKKDGDDRTPVLDWSSVGIYSEDIVYVEQLEDNGYLICIKSGDNPYEVYHIYGDAGNSRTEKTELILGGIYIDEDIRKCVIDFNRTSSDYVITIRDYANNDDPYTSLNLDFTSGKQVDILMTSNLNVENLAKNGALLELSGYFDTSDYVDSYVKAITIDNKIYQVAPNFAVYTLAGKESNVGATSGWNYDEFAAAVKDNSREQLVFGASKYNLLDIMCLFRISDFINEETGEAYFDSEEFREILEYIKNYDKEADMNQNYLDSLYTDETLLQQMLVESGATYMIYETAFDNELTFKGYPLENKAGNYMYLFSPMGISATSDNPDKAWEFVNYVMTYKAQNWESSDGFPTKKDILEDAMKAWKTNKDYCSAIELGGKEVKISLLDKAGEGKLYELINSADTLQSQDDTINKIITEEAFAYFDGNYSLDDTCKNVQSRVELYLKENY